jgi:hypothetical protein
MRLVSPSVRSRRLIPVRPRRPARPRSWTMRACSAGKSSSHTGSSWCRVSRTLSLGDVSHAVACGAPGSHDDLGRTQQATHLAEDRTLDLPGRHASDRTCTRALLQHGGRHVVPIQPPAPPRVARHHGVPGRAEDQASERRVSKADVPSASTVGTAVAPSRTHTTALAHRGG